MKERPKNTKLLADYFRKLASTKYEVYRVTEKGFDRALAYAFVYLRWEPMCGSIVGNNVAHNKCEQMIAKKLRDFYPIVCCTQQFHPWAVENFKSTLCEKIERMINHCRQVCWYWGPIFENDYQYINV